VLVKALQFAASKHKGQVRRVSGLPYVTHPVTVMFLLQTYKESKKLEELLVACLLHDTLEDTDTTFEEISTTFTPLVASLVQELTSDDTEIKRVGKNEYLKVHLKGISSYALVIKLADRLSNVMDAPSAKYKGDTLELLVYLEEHRMLSGSQKEIVNKIRLVLAED